MNRKQSIHFNVSERKILLRVFDIVFVLTSLYGLGVFFNFEYFMLSSAQWSWTVLLSLYLTVFASIFELYDLQKASKFETVTQNVILTTSLTVLCYLFTPFLAPELPENRLQIIYFYLAITIALFLWRYAYITLVSIPRFNKKALLIASASQVEIIVDSLEKSNPNYQMVGFVDIAANRQEDGGLVKKDILRFTPNDISTIVRKHYISEIVVASFENESITTSLYNQLINLLEQGIPIKEYTQVYEELTYRVPVQHVERDFYRYFPFSRSNQNKLYLFFHRAFDVLFSVIGLTFGVALLPLILIGNLIGNRGPLFYTQMRVGKNGKHFLIYKFRSMIVGAEKEGAQFALKNDVRVTQFGRFLRNSRLDEMPQFINIIKGHMCLIGPRPERPVFVKELTETLPFYEVRHLVKPGLTGWAQVNARYGVSKEDALEKLQYDLYYIKRRGFFLDISIIIKTLSTVIFYRGQ